MREGHAGEDVSAVIGAFGRIASAVVAGRQRNEVLGMIAASTRQLVDADLAAVVLHLPGDDLLITAADGLDADRYRGMCYRAAGTSSEHVVRTGESVVVENLSNMPVVEGRITGLALGPTAFVPITVDGPNGALGVSRLVGRDQFDQEDIALVRTFAGQAALILERDCQRRRARELDRITEQTRIATELHENAAGEVFSASLLLSRLASDLDENASERALLIDAIDRLDHSIKLIRDAAFNLSGRN
jgi:GAF domain-containing protein